MSNKPFDLEKALAGEPVKLRDGSKAYVKYVMPDQYTGNYPLRGFNLDEHSDTGVNLLMWGMSDTNPQAPIPQYNIIGMWEEPRPRVQLDLPCPLKEPQEGMWYFINSKIYKSSYIEGGEQFDIARLKSGGYFATKEDAQEWLDAMRNARR